MTDSKKLSLLKLKNKKTRIEAMEVFFLDDNIPLVTIHYLEKVLGVTRQTINGWERRGLDNSPISSQRLKVFDFEYVKSWRKNNIDLKQSAKSSKNEIIDDDENEYSGVDLDSVPIGEAQRRKEIEAVKKLILQNKIIDGENISVDSVDKNMATQAATHISHLTNSEKILPSLLENKSASDIQDILNEHNQMQIEQLFRITNKELAGENELFDVFMKVIDKIDDGVSVEDLIKGVDKIVIS